MIFNAWQTKNAAIGDLMTPSQVTFFSCIAFFTIRADLEMMQMMEERENERSKVTFPVLSFFIIRADSEMMQMMEELQNERRMCLELQAELEGIRAANAQRVAI